MGKLLFEKVTKDIETIDSSSFDCGVDSINGYIRESYYPTIFQEAYAYRKAFIRILSNFI